MLYLTYKEEKLPVKISYSALKHTINEYEKKTGVKLNLTNIMAGGLDVYEYLLFYGMKAGFRDEEMEFTYKLSDMETILDDCMMDFIDLVAKSFPTNKESKQ